MSFAKYEEEIKRKYGKTELTKYQFVQFNDVRCPVCRSNQLCKDEKWNRGKDEAPTSLFYCDKGHFFTKNQ